MRWGRSPESFGPDEGYSHPPSHTLVELEVSAHCIGIDIDHTVTFYVVLTKATRCLKHVMVREWGGERCDNIQDKQECDSGGQHQSTMIRGDWSTGCEDVSFSYISSLPGRPSTSGCGE